VRGRRGRDGFEELYAAERDGLLRLAVLVCHDRGRAEDAVAEAFARVYPKWRAGGVDRPAFYLRRAVLNQLTGGFRRRAVERREAERLWGDERGETVFDVLLSDRAALVEGLASLSENQRAVLVLRFYEDRSEAEIADILDVPTGTVKSRCARALARLRDLLEEERVDA
jgi:RNA polymerase sigma-70 factor (sigma-E family)